MFYAKMYNKATIYVNEMMLTPLSPFDIQCKKLNSKKLWYEKSLEM